MNYFYKIIVAYDGTDYQGWQEQEPTVLTISGQLKKTFKQVFHNNISIKGASRTDAGVHALGQVARIITDFEIDPEILKEAWNNSLPKDILIVDAQLSNQDFNPLKNVLQKTYYYNFYVQRPLPFNARYGLYYPWNLDLKKLDECLKVFIGEHDFRSFCTGYEMESTIRTIDEICLLYLSDLNLHRIVVKGKSFLHHMIRRIVGACLEVASRPNIPVSYLNEILEQKNPAQSLPNAPAAGLMLYKIDYS